MKSHIATAYLASNVHPKGTMAKRVMKESCMIDVEIEKDAAPQGIVCPLVSNESAGVE